MKEIMKALCGLWKEEWQGMVMGQLNYEKGEGACGGPYFVSASGRRILKVSAFGGNERMEILLFPFPMGKERRKRGRRGDSGALFQKERSTPSAFLWETIMGFTRPAARW